MVLYFNCSIRSFSNITYNYSHVHDLKNPSSLPGSFNSWKLKILNIYFRVNSVFVIILISFLSWSYIALKKLLEKLYLDPPHFLIKLDWTFEHSATSPLPQQPMWIVEDHLTRGLTTSRRHYATKCTPYDLSYTIVILAYV